MKMKKTENIWNKLAGEFVMIEGKKFKIVASKDFFVYKSWTLLHEKTGGKTKLSCGWFGAFPQIEIIKELPEGI